MQTKYTTRQASLITEAIETIQASVKANKGAIPYPNSGLLMGCEEQIHEIGIKNVYDIYGESTSYHDLESDTIMQLADYCLNYKA